MKVILKADVQHLGKVGDIVKVKNGFARNFLFPRKLAQEATQKRVKELQHLLEMTQFKKAKLFRGQQELLGQIAQTELVIQASAGESEKLFGAITSMDIAKALEAKGLRVDRKHIHIQVPIKQLGQHTVSISLDKDLKADITICVEKRTLHPEHGPSLASNKAGQNPSPVESEKNAEE